MITIAQIRQALTDKNYSGLRILHDQAKIEGIEDCDADQLITLNLEIIHCSLYGDKSPGHLRGLNAMLDAIERGNHPYDDIIATSIMGADAVIAQAQINAMVDPKNG